MQERHIQFLGEEDPLEKEMATHPNILAQEIPGTEEPGRLQSMGVAKELDMTERLKQQQQPDQLNESLNFSKLCQYPTSVTEM